MRGDFRSDRRQVLWAAGLAVFGGFPGAARAAGGESEPKPIRTVRLQGPALDGIEAVGFSADRKSLLTAHTDDLVKVWDLATGRELHSRAAGLTGIQFVAFAEGGRAVVFRGKAGAAGLWRPAGSEAQSVLAAEAGEEPWTVAVSADGRRLATVHDGDGGQTLVRMRDLATGREVFRYNNENGHRIVYALAFAPDGTTLALGDQGGAVRLLDAATGRPTAALKEGRGDTSSLAWSPDGQTIAAATVMSRRQTVIRTWDVSARRLQKKFAPVPAVVSDLTFSPDGKVLAGLPDAERTA
jgi:WD40 repeat protein